MSQLKIYYPVKPSTINQPFGVNGAYYESKGVNIIGHNGIDFAATHAQPVYATHDGVAYPEEDENQGFGVVLITNQPFDYVIGQVYFKTIYWHLINDIPVKTGDAVKAGDLLGYANNTGLSTGDHLHFGLKPVLSSNEPPFAWETINPNNGYLGAIDPTPYFNGLFAQDIANAGKFIFNTNIGYGSQSYDVSELQQRLKDMGLFPATQVCTGFFGPKTAAAVLAFQLKYAVDTTASLNALGGKSCGPKTRAKLNSL